MFFCCVFNDKEIIHAKQVLQDVSLLQSHHVILNLKRNLEILPVIWKCFSYENIKIHMIQPNDDRTADLIIRGIRWYCYQIVKIIVVSLVTQKLDLYVPYIAGHISPIAKVPKRS